VDLRKLLYLLWQQGVKRLMVEGGATLNWSLVSQKLVDEIYVYVGTVIIGGKKAPTLIDGEGFVEKGGMKMMKLELLSVEKMDGGVLLRWRV
jgi:2,5-diamino-6-(ribosylamino)-4(3H)-pyrimidinone 5'-phosphate reductase